MQSAALPILVFSFISCVNGCVSEQRFLTEVVWLAAAGSDAPPLRKRAKRSHVG